MKTERFECDYCKERHFYAWQAAMCCDASAFGDDEDEIRSVN